MLKYRVSLIIVALLTTACGIDELMEKSSAIEDQLEARHDLSATIGIRVNNGILANVSVVLDEEDAAPYTVDELSDMIFPIILDQFDQTPDAISLQVSFTRDLSRYRD